MSFWTTYAASVEERVAKAAADAEAERAEAESRLAEIASTHEGEVAALLRFPMAPEVEAYARRFVEMPHPERVRRERRRLYAGYLPKTLPLWRERDGHLEMPRGVWTPGLGVRDARAVVEAPPWPSLELRPYQEQAAHRLLEAEQGLLQFGTGGGKTHTALELARLTGQRTLVIVGSRELLNQWQRRVREDLDFEPGILGGGKNVDSDRLVIATQQTLYARSDALDGWLAEFGTVISDECHHLPAETWFSVMAAIPARYRFGLSATPHKKENHAAILRYVLGDVVVEATYDELEAVGAIVRPDVRVVSSPFDFDYQGDWSALVAAMVADPHRTALVAELIVKGIASGRTLLLPAARLDMLHAVRDAVAVCVPADFLPVLVGSTPTRERAAIRETVARGGCCLFSTLAGEALDLPRLDAVVLALPLRNAGAVEQLVGRLTRPHAGKLPPRVVDVADTQSLLAHQQWQRSELYERLGLAVDAASADDAWA